MKVILVVFLVIFCCDTKSLARPQNNEETSESTKIGVKIDEGKRKVHPRNSLFLGNCETNDPQVYVDNTIVENSGPGVLNGTIEIYIDAPVEISW